MQIRSFSLGEMVLKNIRIIMIYDHSVLNNTHFLKLNLNCRFKFYFHTTVLSSQNIQLKIYF